jgi:hypothetical protein
MLYGPAQQEHMLAPFLARHVQRNLDGCRRLVGVIGVDRWQ